MIITRDSRLLVLHRLWRISLLYLLFIKQFFCSPANIPNLGWLFLCPSDLDLSGLLVLLPRSVYSPPPPPPDRRFTAPANMPAIAFAVSVLPFPGG